MQGLRYEQLEVERTVIHFISSSINPKIKFMRKLILNIVLLNILAAPCILTFNDIDQETNDWNYTINIIGIIYSIWFYNYILNPIFKPLFRKEEL